MRHRASSRLLCIPIIAAFAAGCSDPAPTNAPGPDDKPVVTPVYAGGSTTPPTKVGGKTVKNPKIINQVPPTNLAH
jgi:hypothetical protein